MYTILVFLALNLIEVSFIYWRWSKISDYREITSEVIGITKLDQKMVYKKSIRVIGNVLNNFKTLLIIPIVVVSFLNLLISILIGLMLYFIM